MTDRNVSATMPLLLRPWGNLPRLWRSLAYLAIGVPLGMVSFTTILGLSVLTLSLLITLVLAIPAAWALFIAARILGGIDRSRAASLLGMELVDPVPPLQGRNWFRRLWERIRTRSRWREIANAYLLFPVSLACWLTTVTTWAGSLTLLAMRSTPGACRAGPPSSGCSRSGRVPDRSPWRSSERAGWRSSLPG